MTRWLRQHLLGKQIAAEGDAAAESHCSEISTLAALVIGPGLQRRYGKSDRRSNDTEELVVGADSAELAAFFGSFGAKLQKLNDPREILR